MRSCVPARSGRYSCTATRASPGAPRTPCAGLVTAAMAPLRAFRERPASYFNETDYFEADWQTAFWGDHYARLLRVKERYDPGGLFFVHYGVGTGT